MDSKTIRRDIARLLESIQFEDVIRYRDDPLWKQENRLQDFIEKKPFHRLESDADHSWHLADMVLLLGPHFSDLDLDKAVKFALLHDKMEIFTGDYLAVGLSGTGNDSHAFNYKLKVKKEKEERSAMRKYLRSLPEDVARYQQPLFEEYFSKVTPEARFVNALDKMQVLVRFLYAKNSQPKLLTGQAGKIWWKFVDLYHRPKVAQFPQLIPYGEELLRRIKFKRS